MSIECLSTCACPAGKPGLITTITNTTNNGIDTIKNCTQGSEVRGGDIRPYDHCSVNLMNKYYCKL